MEFPASNDVDVNVNYADLPGRAIVMAAAGSNSQAT